MIYSRWSLLPVAVQASAAGQGLRRIYVARFPTPAVAGSQESGRAGASRKVKVTFRGGTVLAAEEKGEKGWQKGVEAGSREVPFQPDPFPTLSHGGPSQAAFLS